MQLRAPKGGLSLRMAALFLSLTVSAAAAPELEAKLRLYKPDCSSADIPDVEAAIHGASALLKSCCQLSLRYEGHQSLPLDSQWCHLPDSPVESSKALQALAAQAKAHHPRELALFLLPSSADQRLSWALVDTSLRSACDSPQERRFLARFGNIFFTDLTWMQAADGKEPSRAALLVAHEVLHSLTQRGHPTGTEPGSVMADHVAGLGPKIGEDWCACARRSPYVSPLPTPTPAPRHP